MRRWLLVVSLVAGFGLLGIVAVAAPRRATTDLVVTSDGPTVLGELTTLTATLPRAGFDYTWDLGDDTAATGAVVTHTYATVSDYTAAVTATDGGQTYYATATISVDIPVGAPLLAEGFEGANFPPTDWLRSRQTAVSTNWSRSSTYVHSGEFGACHDDLALPPGGMQDAWFVSPQVTPTSESEVAFWQWERYRENYHKHSIWVSTGNQDPKYDDFVELVEVKPGPESAWEEVRLGLGDYAGEPIYLAFRYEGDFADEWCIDEVRVTSALLASQDGPKEPGEAVTFTAKAATGSRVSYAWAFGDGERGSGAVITHPYEALGDYTVVVTASNSTGALTKTLTVPIRAFVYLPLVQRD